MQLSVIIFYGLVEHVIYELESRCSNLEASFFNTYNTRIKKYVNTLIFSTGKIIFMPYQQI